MKTNTLNHYVDDLLDSIEQNLSRYLKNKIPECLHQLRVDIKKIKAVFSFSAKVYKEKYSATKLKPLFIKAGKLRDIQISIHLLGLFTHPPNKLIRQLKNKENILTIQFIKCGPQYIRHVKIVRKKVCLPELLPDTKTIIQYFKKTKKNVLKKLKSKDRKELHKYRAKIKELMYIYNVLPKNIQKKIELNEAKINKQQEKLGDWHDTLSLIESISHEKFPLKTAEYVVKLKKLEKSQFKTLIRNLTNHGI